MLRVAEHFERTDTGRQRRANEDAYFARSPLFVVADGMGGARAGEVASGTAVEVLSTGLGDGPGSAEERLAARVGEANTRIHELSVTDRDRAGMGTTVTAAYVGENDVSIAHVGDSRAYRLRDGDFERLTHDHSLVEEFVRQGKLTPQEADEHPQRSIITRALGPEAEVEVDRVSVRGRPGDVFLLCSDGLTSMVAEARVADVVREARSLQDAGRALVEAANAAGGRDNITVVLFRLEDVDGAGGDHATQPHATVDRSSEDTMLGTDAPTSAEVRAAVAAAPPVPPAEPAAVGGARRLPRPPRGDTGDRGRRGRVRWVGPLVVVLVLLVPILGGAYLATQAVYFLGSDDQGAVAVFQGLPYRLPAGVDLYRTEYVTGLSLDQLSARQRGQLLDHKLRSHDDARDLARQLELGQLSTR